MATASLTVRTENILPIIKKWLYTESEVFVRELLSNARDALEKLQILAAQGEVDSSKEDLRIDVQIDKDNGLLLFIDNGIGMNQEEVETYIAQLAFSGAEDFLKHYQSDRSAGIIGHFGLGFYSAYMVADRIELETRSYRQDDAPVYWSCDGSAQYTIEKGSRQQRGTTIKLHVGKEHLEFLEEKKLRAAIDKYCRYLSFPIYLDGQQINTQEPLWIKEASDCSNQQYQQFYRQLYPFATDSIFWIHLNVSYPFHLQGILYFPQINKQFEWSKNAIQLFYNRVLVADSCKEIIPEYLTILRGVIDSHDIPLNVSRSSLQMDQTVRQLAGHIGKKVADRLATLYQQAKEEYIGYWPHLEMIVKLGAIQDRKFYERIKTALIWQSLDQEWMTLEEYLQRTDSTQQKKVYYTTSSVEDAHLLHLYRQQGIVVLRANSHLDNALISFLESNHPGVKFQRIDGSLDAAILDAEREKTLLDAAGKTEASHIADFFRQALQEDGLQVEAKSLASDALPALLILEEESRRLRDYLQVVQQEAPRAADQKRTFVVNTNNKLITAIHQLSQQDRLLANKLAQQTYTLALLAQKEFAIDQLGGFVGSTYEILEALLTESAKPVAEEKPAAAPFKVADLHPLGKA